jgi:hypothetical protein
VELVVVWWPPSYEKLEGIRYGAEAMLKPVGKISYKKFGAAVAPPAGFAAAMPGKKS